MDILNPKENDNFDYIANINTITQNLISKWNPNELFITRVDNWFDSKWLNFSGTIMHEISVWQDKTTVPPFHPNRIEYTKYFKKNKGVFNEYMISKPLHIYQESKSNLKREIVEFSKNGLFIWYSGNSKLNNMGVLMCYLAKSHECLTFHITLSGDIDWNIYKTKGIQKYDLELLLKSYEK